MIRKNRLNTNEEFLSISFIISEGTILKKGDYILPETSKIWKPISISLYGKKYERKVGYLSHYKKI